MVLKIASKESEYSKIFSLLIELQKQHVNIYPTLFRDLIDLESFKVLLEKFETEEDNIRFEKGLDTLLYFEQEQNIVGCALVKDKIRKGDIAFVDSHQLYVACFIIDPNYRNQGFGKKCFTLLKEWAKERGYYRMELSVSHENDHAITLYKDLGFQKEMLYMSCELLA